MKLKGPELLNVNIKGARGLAFQEVAYALRPNTFLVASLFDAGKDFIPLKPGEETEVLVPLPSLPVNADVKKISATLRVTDDTSSVKPEQTTVGIEKVGGAKETYRLETEMPTRPRNVEIKLEQGDIFWTFAGTLQNESYDLPDFAEHVNAYLDKVQPENGQISLRFLVKSDTRGKVKIEIDKANLEYSLLQTQTWKNPLDDTVRLDRNLQLDFSVLETVPLHPIAEQKMNETSLTTIKMDIGGEFGKERLLGSVETHDGKEFATISSDYSLAQSFILDTSIQCVGITGFFQADAEAELYIEIQNDLNGFPSVKPPLTKSNLSLAPAENNRRKPWTFANFEAPVDLKADTPYCIIIKGIRGKVQLGLQAQTDKYLRQVLVNRGGQLWKRMGHSPEKAIVTMLRLVYLPEVDNQTAAIEIGLEGTQLLQRLDVGSEAQTVAFDVKGVDIKQALLVIKSHAQGTLSIANIIQEYSPA